MTAARGPALAVTFAAAREAAIKVSIAFRREAAFNRRFDVVTEERIIIKRRVIDAARVADRPLVFNVNRFDVVYVVGQAALGVFAFGS